MRESWQKQVEDLRKLKQDSDRYVAEFEKSLRSLEKEVFDEHCPKRHYMSLCEPAYCVFRFTNTCEFLEKWSDIRNELSR